MHDIIRQSLYAVVLTGGLLVLGAGAVNADPSTASAPAAVAQDVVSAEVAAGEADNAEIMHATGSEIEDLDAELPTQLAATGSGLWPVYLSVITLIAGLGLLVAMCVLSRRTVALPGRGPVDRS